MINIIGTIQRIKSDRKALSLNGDWYNSFKPLDEKIKVDDYVEITYSTKDNFRNIKDIKFMVDKVKPMVKSEVKESNNGNIKLISDQGRNTIIMQSVQIYLSDLNKNNLSLKEITEMVRDSYKVI